MWRYGDCGVCSAWVEWFLMFVMDVVCSGGVVCGVVRVNSVKCSVIFQTLIFSAWRPKNRATRNVAALTGAQSARKFRQTPHHRMCDSAGKLVPNAGKVKALLVTNFRC